MGSVRRVTAWVLRQLDGRASARVVAVLALVFALDSADKGAVGAMALPLQHSFGIGPTKLGLLLTVSSLAGALGTILFGWLVDRASRVRLLLIAVLVWAAAMLATAAATSYLHLLVTRVALGIVTAASIPAVASLTGDYFLSHRRARMYGYILAGVFLGTGFGFVVSGELALLSWRAGFVALVAPALLVAWMLYRLPEPARGGAGRLRPGQERIDVPPPEPGDKGPEAAGAENDMERMRDRVLAAGVAPRAHLVFDENPGKKSLPWAIWYVLHIPTNLILITASALGYYFYSGIRTFGVQFAHEWFGLPHSAAIGLAVLFGLSALVGVVAGGRLADYLLNRWWLSARVYLATCAYLAAAVWLIPAFATHRLWIAAPALVLAALCFGAANPPADAARLDIMHPYLWGRAESIRAVLWLLAEAVAPVVFGYMTQHVFGGGPTSLDRTFFVMLLPLLGSGGLGFIAFRTYLPDVATAEAYTRRTER